MDTRSGVGPFEVDAAEGGYRYTGDRLSCRLANARITEALVELAAPADRKIVDIGCGDGAYSVELLELGAAAVHGVDPATDAVAVASRRSDDPRLSFAVGSAYELPQADGAFELACLRGVLHHVERPRDALREALRVANTVVVVEPNGYNPGLKLIERTSRYHREHGERSYTSNRLDRWVAELGGRVTARRFVGFVPMFSPDAYARAAKRIEPLLERLPGLRRALCAQYVFSAERCP